MLLIKAAVTNFKSIGATQTLELDPDVTVLVGMNEAGKTVFLKSLVKTDDVRGVEEFDPVEDFPRKDLNAYLKRHKVAPELVTVLTYQLNKEEVAEANEDLDTALPERFAFSITTTYDNAVSIGIEVDEQPVIAALTAKTKLGVEAREAVSKVKRVRDIPTALDGVGLTADDTAFKAVIEQRIGATKWDNVVGAELWAWLKARHPKFLYFGDYDLLPSKMNLPDLATRVEQSKRLEPKHRAVLALLRMAGIDVAEVKETTAYEPMKAKIESVSIALTDQILKFWKQNEDLEVEVDIKPDPADTAEFKNGPNLYLRIKNRRHRGVSTPFEQRSRGFVWFFSFLVWFDDVRNQLEKEPEDRGLILLLDEPGLSLHALAQYDFLRYIETLAEDHQVVYTTHSPFMVDPAKLDRVRVVEDKKDLGTTISGNLGGSDPKTLFPLQAALGWTLAQNLFIGAKNLLVEGPAELVFFQAISAMLEAQGKPGLREDVVIVPTGGLDKIVTFVALLGANRLQFAVLHDWKGSADQRIADLIKDKLLSTKSVLTPAQFRGGGARASDTEDLFEPGEYLGWFNATYAKELGDRPIAESELPAGDRIINRIDRALETRGIKVRETEGFNHYRVAATFAKAAPTLTPATLARFEALLGAVNNLF